MSGDFSELLTEQLSLLSDYCDLYDSGKTAHALSIAARLDVILDMLKSRAGGDHMRANDVLLLSTARKVLPHDHKFGFHPLAIARVTTQVGSSTATAEFVPHLSREAPHPPRRLPLGKWRAEHVLGKRGLKLVSREFLITQMRNKAGGAHPYSEPKPDYKEVSDQWGLGLMAIGPQAPQPYDPPAPFATVRQMAYEVSASFGCRG